MNFYTSRVLGKRDTIIKGDLINDADVFISIFFFKFVISGWDVTLVTYLYPLFIIFVLVMH